MIYLLARTAHGRPALQHKTEDFTMTLCGLDTSTWSKAYLGKPIPEILCRKCSRIGGV